MRVVGCILFRSGSNVDPNLEIRAAVCFSDRRYCAAGWGMPSGGSQPETDTTHLQLSIMDLQVSQARHQREWQE
jgi:hypothetical protein